MKRIDLEVTYKGSPEAVLQGYMAGWTRELGILGYSIASQSETSITYSRRYWPALVILGAIFLFPIGLLFLLYKSDASITAIARPDGRGGATLCVSGKGPNKAARVFDPFAPSIVPYMAKNAARGAPG